MDGLCDFITYIVQFVCVWGMMFWSKSIRMPIKTHLCWTIDEASDIFRQQNLWGILFLSTLLLSPLQLRIFGISKVRLEILTLSEWHAVEVLNARQFVSATTTKYGENATVFGVYWTLIKINDQKEFNFSSKRPSFSDM